jgi:hypothetical protein
MKTTAAKHQYSSHSDNSTFIDILMRFKGPNNLYFHKENSTRAYFNGTVIQPYKRRTLLPIVTMEYPVNLSSTKTVAVNV